MHDVSWSQGGYLTRNTHLANIHPCQPSHELAADPKGNGLLWLSDGVARLADIDLGNCFLTQVAHAALSAKRSKDPSTPW